MRSLLPALMLLCGCAAAPDEAPVPLRDAELLRALQGAWCSPQPDGRGCWAYDEFFADGTLRACGRHPEDGTPFDGSGTVTVEGDRMCYRVTRASPGFWVRPGTRFCTRIVGISAAEHVYEDLDSGARFTLRRLPAAEVRCPEG